MRRFLNGCSRHRVTLRGLAAGTAADHKKVTLEKHLATCRDCQNYYEEVKRVVEPLAEWEKAFADVEANSAVEAHWAKDFAAAIEPVRSPRLAMLFFIFDWANELFWPWRRIWAGFAVVWLAILAIDFATRESAPTFATQGSRPSLDMVRAYLETEGVAVEWVKPDKHQAAEPPKPSPRSERRAQSVGA